MHLCTCKKLCKWHIHKIDYCVRVQDVKHVLFRRVGQKAVGTHQSDGYGLKQLSADGILELKHAAVICKVWRGEAVSLVLNVLGSVAIERTVSRLEQRADASDNQMELDELPCFKFKAVLGGSKASAQEA